MQKKFDMIIPPVAVDIDGARVEIFEVIKLSTGYHVTCRINWRGIKSRIFFIDAKDTEDFKRKLELELAKMKTLYIIGGRRYVEEVMCK